MSWLKRGMKASELTQINNLCLIIVLVLIKTTSDLYFRKSIKICKQYTVRLKQKNIQIMKKHFIKSKKPLKEKNLNKLRKL